MRIERFEDAIAWQKSKVLCTAVYKQFENSKDFGFKDQIQRAAVSVMNNIAEGFERKGNKEFAYFLYVSMLIKLCQIIFLGLIIKRYFDKWTKNLILSNSQRS